MSITRYQIHVAGRGWIFCSQYTYEQTKKAGGGARVVVSEKGKKSIVTE